jgi:hypothetical protein
VLDLKTFSHVIKSLTLTGGELKNGTLASGSSITVTGGIITNVDGDANVEVNANALMRGRLAFGALNVNNGATLQVGKFGNDGSLSSSNLTVKNGGTLILDAGAKLGNVVLNVETGGLFDLNSQTTDIYTWNLRGGAIKNGTLNGSLLANLNSDGGVIENTTLTSTLYLNALSGNTSFKGTNTFTNITISNNARLIAPEGNKTTAVKNDFTINAGGIYQATITDGVASQLIVTHLATLTGAKLEVKGLGDLTKIVQGD